MQHVRSNLLDSENWCILRDNAPSNKSILEQQFLASNCVHQLFAVLARSFLADYFFLLPKGKLKGHQYVSIEEIEAAVTSKLNNIRVEAFQKAFTDLNTPSKSFIELKRNYIEA
ncbi:hypothetical protein CDAR_605001 [Caerostris darwini]|uniref:Uncharacterized protein n=1 Tax=Caerostris darwini TaxID=1538125 RepID=A0AAV4X5V9_9ARAC|nr:hypothetical protein CDAR_605001 [Caerostris darwini]